MTGGIADLQGALCGRIAIQTEYERSVITDTQTAAAELDFYSRRSVADHELALLQMGGQLHAVLYSTNRADDGRGQNDKKD